MSENLGKVRVKSGNLIVASQRNNLAVLYSYCNSFFTCNIRREFRLTNEHLFNILPEISSRKVGDFFYLESGDPELGFCGTLNLTVL